MTQHPRPRPRAGGSPAANPASPPPPQGPSRRELQRGALGALFSYSLLGALAGCDAFPREVGPTARAWLRDMQDLAESVQGGAIPQVQWQDGVEALFARVELGELLELIDFERLARRTRLAQIGEASAPVDLPRVEGLPDRLAFGKLFFGLRRGQAIAPHGHYNMVTGFVVLQGRLRARHFDRLEDHPDHMIVAPTIDETFVPGSSSTISDFRDNVHWFVAESERAYLFNVHVHHVDPTIDLHGRVFVDPTGEPLGDGRVRAPKLDRKQAMARFCAPERAT